MEYSIDNKEAQVVELWPYQGRLEAAIYRGWDSGANNVLSTAPTGAGKTVVFSKIIHDNNGASCAIAHRQELVSQIALALARNSVPHRIIGPRAVVKLVVSTQMIELGKSLYNPKAPVAVAGVDTLIRRQDELNQWAKSVTLWVGDEGHHFLKDNKWGIATSMFQNARGLGMTATPLRTDGKGLGSHVDGVFDTLVEGPSMRELIDAGYLTDYRVFVPPSDIDLSDVTISQTTGDYTKPKLVNAIRRSRIIGDVVEHYQKYAAGKLGVTFATDVETATDISKQFNAAGITSEVVSAKTPDAERIAVVRRFRKREIMQLVNVDIYGEGFDLPAIEVISMARPTQSFVLYCQQFGRALRIMQGKQFGIIIDHVGNVIRHGLPDAKQTWSLERRERGTRGNSDAIPVKTCGRCTAAYENVYKSCPYCGYSTPPAARNSPELVAGDLTELDAATLSMMRGDVERVDMHVEQYRMEIVKKGADRMAQYANVNRHVKRQEAQTALREQIAWWAGYQRAAGRPDSESYRRFYYKFGIDVMSAQALNTKNALTLASKINEHMALENNNVSA